MEGEGMVASREICVGQSRGLSRMKAVDEVVAALICQRGDRVWFEGGRR